MPPVSEFQQAERSASRVIDGVAFLVSVDRQMMLELNEVGTFVWEMLARPTALEAIVAGVADEFEVDVETARADVHAFLATLVDRGVVSVREGAPKCSARRCSSGPRSPA